MRRGKNPPIEDVALLADLHGLPSANIAPPLDVRPQREKEKTFEALLRPVEDLLRQQAVLIVFADTHWRTRVRANCWTAPSSAREIGRCCGSERSQPEFQPLWIGQLHVTMLALARLDARDTSAMLANIDGKRTRLRAGAPEEIRTPDPPDS